MSIQDELIRLQKSLIEELKAKVSERVDNSQPVITFKHKRTEIPYKPQENDPIFGYGPVGDIRCSPIINGVL